MAMESSEASEILIIKRKGVRVNRHMGRLRETEGPRGGLTHFYGTFLPGLL